MALKIRIEPTVSAQQRMLNHLQRQLRRHPDLPVIPDRERALVRYRCYECEEVTVWGPESPSSHRSITCDSCLAGLAAEEEKGPQEMVVKHVIEHVHSSEFRDEVIH